MNLSNFFVSGCKLYVRKGPKKRKKRKKRGKRVEILREKKKFVYLHSRKGNNGLQKGWQRVTQRVARGYKKGYNAGLMAEWLGTALQKLLQRFESASDLKKVRYNHL